MGAPRQRPEAAAGQDLGPIAIQGIHPHHPLPVEIVLDPADAGSAARVAREFAQAWARRYHRGSHGTAYNQALALKILFQSLNDAGIATWSDIDIAFLRSVEGTFSQTHYNPRFAWSVMRALPEGTLREEVERFVQSPPAVAKNKSVPTEAIPQAMLRDVLRQAMRDVTRAEARIRSVGWDGHSTPPVEALIQRHETQAFYILLCMEWTMSPDVVAGLSFDPAQPTSVQEWHDGEPKVTLRWFKNRGKFGRGIVMLADKPWRSGSLLRRLRDASAATRHLGGAKWQDHPWVCAQRASNSTRSQLSERDQADIHYWDGSSGIRLLSAHRQANNDNTFRSWCEYEREDGAFVEIDTRYDGSRLSYKAIRPAAKWAQFAATGGGLLLQELVDDNTVETLAAHYLNNAVAMRDIGESFVAIPTLAEEVARGIRPVLVNRDGEVVSGPKLSTESVAIATGENRVGISGCQDPRNSPLKGERAGELCGQANRACFSCPNSVITPSDIPSLLAYLRMAENAHLSLSPPEWELHWGLTVRWVKYALPLLDPNWMDLPVADEDTTTAMFDLGLEAGPA